MKFVHDTTSALDCRLQPRAPARSSLADFSTLKTEVTRSSETLIHRQLLSSMILRLEGVYA
jgi:hypothetical protein